MLRRLATVEQGIALVLALMTMLVLSSLTGAVLMATAVNHRNTLGSSDGSKAFGLAETGLAYAEGRLYSASTSGEPVLVPATTFAQDGGTVSYSGSLSGNTWTLTGTGASGGQTRRVSVQAVVPPPQVVSDPTIWNYLYADNHTTNCAADVQGNVTVNVPIYAQGDLCLNGNVTYKGADLEVGRNLTLVGGVLIGSQSQPISKMNVHGTCSVARCDGSHAPVWVNSPGVGQTLVPALTMPTIDLSGEYATTIPGPAAGHGCQTGSGVPSPFFDGDTTLNDSVASVNLFPSGHPYDCKVGANELKWDGSGGLTVNGAFAFDGNLTLAGNLDITYSGSGTLFFTGKIAISGGVTICGTTATVGGTRCTPNWNPNTNGLILAAGCWANGTGTLVRFATSGAYCVDYSGNKTLQVGTYAVTDFHTGGNVTDMGPAIADTLELDGNMGVMLPFHTLPPGAPTDTRQVTLPPFAPTNWNG